MTEKQMAIELFKSSRVYAEDINDVVLKALYVDKWCNTSIRDDHHINYDVPTLVRDLALNKKFTEFELDTNGNPGDGFLLSTTAPLGITSDTVVMFSKYTGTMARINGVYIVSDSDRHKPAELSVRVTISKYKDSYNLYIKVLPYIQRMSDRPDAVTNAIKVEVEDYGTPSACVKVPHEVFRILCDSIRKNR